MAELAFLDVCSTPNNEVQLSGHLIQLLSSKSQLIQSKYNKYLSGLGADLSVKKLELQVQNREKITGGDFALLFEWKDKDGNNRRSAEVVADNVYFGDSKRDGATGGDYAAPAAGYTAPSGGYAAPVGGTSSGFSEIDDEDGDLPF